VPLVRMLPWQKDGCGRNEQRKAHVPQMPRDTVDGQYTIFDPQVGNAFGFEPRITPTCRLRQTAIHTQPMHALG